MTSIFFNNYSQINHHNQTNLTSLKPLFYDIIKSLKYTKMIIIEGIILDNLIE